jgi:hypothetical protein
MRLIYAAEKQASMRQAWTDVIYLNVIMAVKLLLEALESIESTETERSISPSQESNRGVLVRNKSMSCFSIQSDTPSTKTMTPTIREPSKVFLSRLRLAPFLSIESELRKRLGAFEKEVPPLSLATQQQQQITPSNSRASMSTSCSHGNGFGSANLRKHQYAADLLLRAGWQDDIMTPSPNSSFEMDARSLAGSTTSSVSTWKRPYRGITSTLTRRSTGLGENTYRRKTLRSSSSYYNAQREDDPSRLLSACSEEILDLWNGPMSASIKARMYGADSAA